jgi:hypothetical protein
MGHQRKFRGIRVIVGFGSHVQGCIAQQGDPDCGLPNSRKDDDGSVMAFSDVSPFLKGAVSAFPPSCHALAEEAARVLAPFADNNYRMHAVRLIVLGKVVRIPKRINFPGLNKGWLQIQGDSLPAVQCLCTRSTDGHIRQASMQRVLVIHEAWAVPFVVLLAGEYVVEIIEDMVASLSALNREAYVNFVRENRPTMQLLRSKATSYWNCYYRESYPNRRDYPGLVFLHQLELWAS